MKKIMSRILIIFVIIITLFEFSCSSNVSYAALEITDEFVNSLTGLMGGMVAYGIWMQRLLMLGISTVFNGFFSTSFAACCGVNEGFSVGIATPYSIFFNKYKLFDVNFFDFTKTTENATIIDIRNSVAEWFYILRNIASAVLLCILIYVGIRMALSTVAEEKAKYKKMFFDWACSLALVYVLQYIMIFTVYANNAIVNALKVMYKGTDMDMALLQIAAQAVMPVGISSIIATFVYCFIVFQTIAFMIAYTQRMLKTGFLILISPLISITYSIDKMGDGKAQALNSWLKEFVYTILIQPFHCLIYMAFVTTAVTLLGEGTIIAAIIRIFAGESVAAQLQFNQITNGVLVILCLKFVNDGEKAIRKIFNFQDDGNLTSMAAGALVGVAVIKNAKNIGSKATSTINSAKNAYSKFGGNLKSDIGKFKNSDIGKKFLDSGVAKNINKISQNPTINKGISTAKKSGKWVGDKANKIKSNYKDWSDRKHQQWGKDGNDQSQNKYIRGAKSWLRKQVPTAQNLKNAMPGALGMMAAAMTYAAGDSGAMEAIGIGTAVQKGSQDYFNSTMGTISKNIESAEEKDAQANLDLEKQKRDYELDKAVKANPKLEKRFNTQEKKDRELASFMKDQAILAEYSDGSSYKRTSKEKWEKAKARMKQRKNDGIYHALASRAEIEGKGAEEFKQKHIRDRYDKLNSNGIVAKFGTEQLEEKGKAIIGLIEAYTNKVQKDSTKDDSQMENKLGDNDVSSPERMFETLKNVINKSVVDRSGGSFNVSEIIQNELGIHDDSSEEYQEIVAAVLAYRMMVSNDNVVDNFENAQNLNFNMEDIYRKNHGN